MFVFDQRVSGVDFSIPVILNTGGCIYNCQTRHYDVISDIPFDRVLKLKKILDLSASVDGIKATITKDIYTGNYFIEVCEKSVSKASAILKLKEMYDIDEIVAFGDNVNDVEMLELSDRCYVPENGLPQIREMADMVIEKNDTDSVARFIAEDYYK